MAILIACLLVVGACYSPDLPDCRVRCETAADCAPGQSCSGNLCSGETLCPSDAGSDNAVTDGAADASAIDAAPGTSLLVIKIDDKGRVDVPGAGSCTDMSPGHTCTFAVPMHVPVTLQATPDQDRMFESWMESCSGTIATCVVTPAMPMTHVTAKFKHE